MHPHPFPPEVWSQAVSWLPLSHQKPLLEVSRFFHDITLPFVFSSVKLYILGGSGALDMLDTNNRAFSWDTEQKLVHRTWEILHRILDDVRFARMVRDVTLVAFVDSPAIFEILTLSKALGTLKNLHTLRCYGSSNSAITEIIQAIPPTVQHLLYSTHVSIDVLDRLPNLEFFEYRNIIYFPEDGANDDISSPMPPRNTLTGLKFTPSIHHRLHALSIDVYWVDRIPVWVYNQLTALELSSGDSEYPISLDFICHHCPVLEDLSIVGAVDVGVCSNLPQQTTFPKLQSFRISCLCSPTDEPFSEEFTVEVSRFIQSHKNLRRLYIRFPSAKWFTIEALLADIRELPCLEVLGLHTGWGPLNEDDLKMVMVSLPLGLKALQLAMDWDASTGAHVPVLMTKLSCMENLEFLHIYGTYLRLPLSVEEVAMELKNITTVALTRAVWNIDRTGPDIEMVKWPRWKIKFFAESDFLDPDYAWLFKYH
ncbi:hypothetical protein P691DRAFT_673428 [Macrolepiota fuliginosa MF-IS2]|uniref:F-box domain-containing protein n=1 Tax=Macrolepiota fuliginosa MF-IS2 TaxID=1400762 RepID=A0A9P5X7Z3_9AGAR|nr:hypothetical protein P691DRAFT_673428 [Macrolepiota fuliginosa MF-IS2]